MNILSKLPVVILLLISALGVIVGDFFAKYWSLHQRLVFYILAIIGYLISSIFFIPSLLKEGLVVTSVIWSLLSIIGFLFVGLIIFKESLSPLQIIGIVLGIMSLTLLSLSVE